MGTIDDDLIQESCFPDLAERRQVYEKVREDLLKRSLSNSESFDRAVLSLAASIIGFTTVFLKDIKESTSSTTHIALKIGIWLLALAVITTILSIFASQHALDQQIDRAGKVFLDGDESARGLTISARATSWLNLASGLFFALGIMAFVAFITTSLA